MSPQWVPGSYTQHSFEGDLRRASRPHPAARISASALIAGTPWMSPIKADKKAFPPPVCLPLPPSFLPETLTHHGNVWEHLQQRRQQPARSRDSTRTTLPSASNLPRPRLPWTSTTTSVTRAGRPIGSPHPPPALPWLSRHFFPVVVLRASACVSLLWLLPSLILEFLAPPLPPLCRLLHLPIPTPTAAWSAGLSPPGATWTVIRRRHPTRSLPGQLHPPSPEARPLPHRPRRAALAAGL